MATPVPRSLRGVLLPPFFPLSPLLLLSTFLVLRRSALRLPRADAAAARAKGARVVAVTAGEAAGGGGGGSGGGGSAGGASGSGGGWWRQRRGRWQEWRQRLGWRWTRRQQGWGGRGGAGAAVVVAVEALAVARASSTLPRPRRSFPQATELPRWLDLLKKGIDIYALDFDAILSAMYVMSTSGEGAEYLSVPPDPGIRARASAAPGTRVSATPGAGEAAALGARVSPPLVSCPPPCSCRSLAHETSSGHHRLGHPSVQQLRAMHSRYLVSLACPGSYLSLPPLAAPDHVARPCVEGRQRAAPHSSSFPPTMLLADTPHGRVGPSPRPWS
ncbi:unnamed protein product, partial [Closterium sp. NIES-64]